MINWRKYIEYGFILSYITFIIIVFETGKWEYAIAITILIMAYVLVKGWDYFMNIYYQGRAIRLLQQQGYWKKRK